MSAVFSRARCEPAARTANAQRSVSMDWCKGVGLARGAMPCAAVEICKQCSSAAEALPQQRRSRGTASFTKVRAPLLATRAEKPAKMHSDCQMREGAGRTAAPDHAMVSSSDRHRETPPTSTKPTTKTTMSCEAMGAAHSIAWSPLAPGAAAGRPPSPLGETAGGAARLATTRQADATISECCTRGCTLCFLSGHVELRLLHLPFLQD